ncbi:hypothetical protein [Undibacterium sp. YM2]|uniref:hypothetical protein n=1 Tax=Undibacterium sp. YM2 TaxID=2058625 RepID=UPI00138A51B7|nr:hypothetical protein [Undibacterium sp. YM2]
MRHSHSIIAVGIVAGCAACTTLPVGNPPLVHIETPRVYNDVGLQQRLLQVRDRLARLYGLDQTQLSTHVGTLQGADLRKMQGVAQASMLPVPGVQTVSNTGTLNGSTQTVTNQNNSTNSTTTQSTTNSITPNNTTQTTTNTPAVTPAPAALATTTGVAAPTQFSQNGLGTLEEQYQLEMELVTLQTLLEPPVNAEYSVDGNARRLVTIGIPITIPATATRDSMNAAVEVHITICPDKNVTLGSEQDSATRPSLVRIIPKEKTYNTAAVTSKMMGLGLGAISGIFNVSGNFSWTHDTYFMVRAQDTVAFTGERTTESKCSGKGTPLRFGWMFKPVLGQKVVQAGVREALAQLSLPGGDVPLDRIIVRSNWRRFDSSTGTAGEMISEAGETIFNNVRTSFDTLNLTNIEYQNTKNGTGAVTLFGHFLPGTKVRLGMQEQTNVDFSSTALRFTTTNQALATSSLTLISPDGGQLSLDQSRFPVLIGLSGNAPINRIRGNFQDVTSVQWPAGVPPRYFRVAGGTVELDVGEGIPNRTQLVRSDRQNCNILANSPELPYQAKVRTVSATLVEVALPLHQCIEINMDGNHPLIAVIGNQAYGFPETEFSYRDSKEVRFIAPRSIVESTRTVELGRLLLGHQYRNTYLLPQNSQFRVDSIAISSTSDKEIRYLVLGSSLDQNNIVSPAKPIIVRNSVFSNGTVQEISLSAADAVAVKKIVFQKENDAPYVFDLPQPEKKADTKVSNTNKDGKASKMASNEEKQK